MFYEYCCPLQFNILKVALLLKRSSKCESMGWRLQFPRLMFCLGWPDCFEDYSFHFYFLFFSFYVSSQTIDESLFGRRHVQMFLICHVFAHLHSYDQNQHFWNRADTIDCIYKGWNRGDYGMLQCMICLVFRAKHFRDMFCIHLRPIIYCWKGVGLY